MHITIEPVIEDKVHNNQKPDVSLLFCGSILNVLKVNKRKTKAKTPSKRITLHPSRVCSESR